MLIYILRVLKRKNDQILTNEINIQESTVKNLKTTEITNQKVNNEPFITTEKLNPIMSYNQYLQKQKEFSTKYEEYTNIRNQIENLKNKFIEFDEKWKRAIDPKEKEELNKQITFLFNENFEVFFFS